MFAAAALAAFLATAPLGDAETASSRAAAARLTHQSILGVLGAGAGGFAGLFVGSLVRCSASGWCSYSAMYGLISGAFVGSGAAVQLAGQLLGGQSPWWATAAGGATGAAAGLLIGSGINALSGGITLASFVSIFALTIAGGVVGYELGHRARSSSARVTVVPTAGLAGSGLALIAVF